MLNKQAEFMDAVDSGNVSDFQKIVEKKGALGFPADGVILVHGRRHPLLSYVILKGRKNRLTMIVDLLEKGADPQDTDLKFYAAPFAVLQEEIKSTKAFLEAGCPDEGVSAKDWIEIMKPSLTKKLQELRVIGGVFVENISASPSAEIVNFLVSEAGKAQGGTDGEIVQVAFTK
ncbi:MAG: hypothetical protein ACTSXQ_02265 [Alphaproteobacteria bacterium]